MVLFNDALISFPFETAELQPTRFCGDTYEPYGPSTSRFGIYVEEDFVVCAIHNCRIELNNYKYFTHWIH